LAGKRAQRIVTELYPLHSLILYGVDVFGINGLEKGFNAGGYPGDGGTVALARLKSVAVGIPNSFLIISILKGPLEGNAIILF